MITREKAVEVVNTILVEEFEIEPKKITPESELMAIGLDSLDAVDLIIALEHKFGIKVDETEARELARVGDIYDFILKMAEKIEKPTIAESQRST